MIQLRKVVAIRGNMLELRHQLPSGSMLAVEHQRQRTYGPSLLSSRSFAPWAVPAPLNARI